MKDKLFVAPKWRQSVKCVCCLHLDSSCSAAPQLKPMSRFPPGSPCLSVGPPRCGAAQKNTRQSHGERPPDVLCLLSLSPLPHPAQVKKFFELEPLARGKRWILEGSNVDNMETVKETFGQFISLLEDKDTEPARI